MGVHSRYINELWDLYPVLYHTASTYIQDENLAHHVALKAIKILSKQDLYIDDYDFFEEVLHNLMGKLIQEMDIKRTCRKNKSQEKE